MAGDFEVVKAGWLEKKSMMRWQRRYFVLLRQSNHRHASLAYFREEVSSIDEATLGRAKGVVDLCWGTKVDGVRGREHSFQVTLAKHALKCDAGTAAGRAAWVAALRDEVKGLVKEATQTFNGEEWCIDPKYELIKKVGSGAYGFVASAVDTSPEAKARCGGVPHPVAIKKVAGVFEDVVDAKRILREPPPRPPVPSPPFESRAAAKERNPGPYSQARSGSCGTGTTPASSGSTISWSRPSARTLRICTS